MRTKAALRGVPPAPVTVPEIVPPAPKAAAPTSIPSNTLLRILIVSLSNLTPFSIRKRFGTDLELDHLAAAFLAARYVPVIGVPVGGPHSPALPPGVGIINPPVIAARVIR